MKLLFLVFLFFSCKQNQPTIIQPTIVYVDTVKPTILFLKPNCDSLQVIIDSLASKLLYERLRINNVKYYLKICDKNPSQVKFLRGWLHRVLD